MNLIKPKNLKKGDNIAIIAPAGEVEKPLIEKARAYFQSQEFNVFLGKNIFKSKNYLAGSDEERLEDLHWAFLNPEIDGIICARGGYGSIRLINKINYDIIKNNPKIFCGYSDITALSAMIFKNAGLITYSGAMAQSDFSKTEIDEFTQNEFWKALIDDNYSIEFDNKKIYRHGLVQGNLIAGNLATFASLSGIDFIPDEKFVFMTEDINEPVYKIDKYFRQLLNTDKFRNNLSGILLGDFVGVDNEQWLNDLWTELAQELKIPIASGFPISHSSKKSTIPYGIPVKIAL